MIINLFIDQIIIVAISIVVMIIGVIWKRRDEKREWNNGICSESGKPWRLFYSDSQGGRGYTDDEGNSCWITYNIDKPI